MWHFSKCGDKISNVADNIPFSLVYLDNMKITPSSTYQSYCIYFATRFGIGKTATQFTYIRNNCKGWQAKLLVDTRCVN